MASKYHPTSAKTKPSGQPMTNGGRMPMPMKKGMPSKKGC